MFTAALKMFLGGVASAATDAYFNLVTLLLPGNGTNGAQNNTFLDSSTNNFTITRNGNTTQGTFTPFSQTGWGNYLDGTSGQYLNTVANTVFNFGTGDFTVESWVYPTGTNTTAPMPIIEVRTASTNSTGFAFVRVANALTLNVYTNGAYAGASTNSMTLNAWNHVALTRSGNTWTYWINGVSGGSFTNSSTQSDGGTTGPKIGGSTTAGEVWIGYLSNVRITKGGALYSSTFTPSTTPLTTTVSAGTVSLLTCQSNRFVDNSSNAFAITVNGTPSVQAFSPFAPTAAYSASTIGGSGYFDGSGDYLNFTDASNNLDLGGATASLEFWLYPTASTAAFPLFTKNGGTADYNTSTGIEYTCGFNSAQFLMYYNTGGSFGTLTDSTTRPLNQWYHVVYASNATNVSLFVNGVRTATVAATISKPTTRTTCRVGTDLSGNYATGYFSGFRFIQGSGAYDAGSTTLTIPTAPPTAITNTQLLLNYTNAGITDATAKNDLETVGNAQISTTQSKWGGSSMSFDGTTNCRVQTSSSAAPPLFNMGTGDYTVEFWVYTGTPAAQQIMFDMRSGDVTGQGYSISISTSRQIKLYYTADRIISSAISANTWTHVAVVRASGVYTMYINGVSAGTYANTDTVAPPANRPYIGAGADGAQVFNGYIDDLRITKGYARYTANFTAPTAAFPVQ